MIHYHGTPITPLAQLMRMAGRHFCVSFARPDSLKTCLQIGQSVMFDNGAFSAFTKGIPFDRDDYYEWLTPILSPPHWAVVPDVIGGHIDMQRAMVKSWPFRRDLGAPVWHMHLPLEYLLELTSEWPRVCIGSSEEFWEVGSDKWAGRMDEAFNALARWHTTMPWVHGLRMLDMATERWPLASADSTNVAQNYKRDTGCAECKAAPLDGKNPATKWRQQPTQARLLHGE